MIKKAISWGVTGTVSDFDLITFFFIYKKGEMGNCCFVKIKEHNDFITYFFILNLKEIMKRSGKLLHFTRVINYCGFRILDRECVTLPTTT